MHGVVTSLVNENEEKRLSVTLFERKESIGIDLDVKNQFQILKAYFNACKLGIVTIEQTANGKVHLQIYGNFSESDGLLIRSLLNDDKERIRADLDKLKMGYIEKKIVKELFDTMFDGKVINGKRIANISFDPLKLPFNLFKNVERRNTVK